jgi:broad specificity phosphatase PhoE/rRNA maturation protein Nop10
MKIYALRHGQTTDTEGTIHSSSESPLSAAGLEQVQDAAKGLRGKGINRVFYSPTKPATETAEVIAKYLDMREYQLGTDRRLRGRDYGEFEYRKTADVDMGSLCRYTDNAPIRDGETVMDVVARVFDFLDETIRRYGHETVLLVASACVLRAVQWYFGGLPEAGNETVTEIDHCRCYEFDTDSIPKQIRGYRIVWDKQVLKERLWNLCRMGKYKPNYTTCFAMCYYPTHIGDGIEEYKCAVCGSVTEHRADYLYELTRVRHLVETMMSHRVKVDMTFDEREYCIPCSGKEIHHPKPVLGIRFSPNDEYHKVRTDNHSDYQCLAAFIRNYDEYEGGGDGYDYHYPLSAHVDQIVRMTGFPPEFAEHWKERTDKEIAKAVALIKSDSEITLQEQYEQRMAQKQKPSIGAGSAAIIVYDKSLKMHPSDDFLQWLKAEGFTWDDLTWGPCKGYQVGVRWVYVNMNSKLYAYGIYGIKVTKEFGGHAVTIDEFKAIYGIFKKYDGKSLLEFD